MKLLAFMILNCFVAVGIAENECSSLPEGTTIAITGSDIQYYVCVGNSVVQLNCPNGFIFNPISSSCVNPCGAYDPVPSASIYCVESPSSASDYYICTGGTSGSLQKCPANTKFYPALGSLSPTASCINASLLNKLCPATSYAVLPLNPNPSCTSTRLTPYYILCNNGVARIQRCPLGSIINESGYCSATSLNCERSSIPSEVSTCICG